MYPAPEPTRLQREGSRVIVTGDLDRSARDSFWKELERVLTGRADEVQVHLGGVTFIDAAGLTVLLRAQRTASELGLRLVLEAPSLPVLRMLDRTQATPLFDVRR
jgi:anti-sigma B factor antagonist